VNGEMQIIISFGLGSCLNIFVVVGVENSVIEMLTTLQKKMLNPKINV